MKIKYVVYLVIGFLVIYGMNDFRWRYKMQKEKQLREQILLEGQRLRYINDSLVVEAGKVKKHIKVKDNMIKKLTSEVDYWHTLYLQQEDIVANIDTMIKNNRFAFSKKVEGAIVDGSFKINWYQKRIKGDVKVVFNPIKLQVVVDEDNNVFVKAPKYLKIVDVKSEIRKKGNRNWFIFGGVEADNKGEGWLSGGISIKGWMTSIGYNKNWKIGVFRIL